MTAPGDLLRGYQLLGWRLVPIPAGGKATFERGWPTALHPVEEIERHLAGGGNVGLLTGSGDIADVDLDCPEALALAPLYLPKTGAIFGRPAKPSCHHLYVAPGATYASFSDPMRDGEMMAELRAPGATGGGHLTVIPPSSADGEQRTWLDDRIEPATISAAILAQRVGWLGIACLTARYVSEHAARRPGWDLLDILWEADPEQLGRRAYRWAGKRAPDERPPDRKPRRDYSDRELRIEEIVAAIPNNCGWDDRNRIGLAIYAASGGSELGFICFDDFSARSPKYDPRETLDRWRNYRRSPPTRIGLGTLVHLARQAGWRREHAS